MEIWIHYELRAPEWAAPREAYYSAAIEQTAWVDGRGLDRVTMPEHHGADDGYISAPTVMCGAIAARTKQLQIMQSVVIAPVHHPLHLAEHLAVLDLVSGGRLEVVLGMGYRQTEFRMFGVDPAQRVRLTTECFATLRQAFTGEPFEFEGRKVRVMPPPSRPGGPPLFLAGTVPATARRAARVADGYFPLGGRELIDEYRRACAERGKEPGPIFYSTGPSLLYVTHDPDRAWSQVMPYVLHYMESYGSWTQEDAAMAGFTRYTRPEDPEVVRSSPYYRVVTPDECVELLREFEQTCTCIGINPQMGGIPPDLGWESLELFVNEVVPRYRALASEGPSA
jgi:alkanesulfonate monooxygenase SsuD/methylene tetrahydromethanopterin reductase-like flavin-dependent oxidoreductase (luciferase family)